MKTEREELNQEVVVDEKSSDENNLLKKDFVGTSSKNEIDEEGKTIAKLENMFFVQEINKSQEQKKGTFVNQKKQVKLVTKLGLGLMASFVTITGVAFLINSMVNENNLMSLRRLPVQNNITELTNSFNSQLRNSVETKTDWESKYNPSLWFYNHNNYQVTSDSIRWSASPYSVNNSNNSQKLGFKDWFEMQSLGTIDGKRIYEISSKKLYFTFQVTLFNRDYWGSDITRVMHESLDNDQTFYVDSDFMSIITNW